MTKGTKEWADSNVNFQLGCKNNCRYCYAKGMALRFGRIKNEEEWATEVIDREKVRRTFGKRQGRVMFPTTHDLNDENYLECGQVIENLLRAGNDILITTKPRYSVIMKLCDWLNSYMSDYHSQDHVQFRFTITAMNDDILQYWEPIFLIKNKKI